MALNAFASLLCKSSIFVASRQLSSISSLERCIPLNKVREQLMTIAGSSGTPFEVRDCAALTEALAREQQLGSQSLAKPMSASYQEALLSLRTQAGLSVKYVNTHNGIRIGRLLEDLDILGVLISYRHAWQPHWAERAPVTIVTAFVDGVCVHTPIIPANRDLRLSGFVSWVGSSSIEVTMKIEQQAGEDGAAGVAWTPVLDATFVNAARHPLENRAAKLNPLLLESAADREIFQRGERAKAYRLQQASQSVLSVVPRNEEIAKIHRMFLDTIDPKSFTFSRRRLPVGSVWLRDTMLKTAHLCHPEQMNVYCKVFGGFLMRKALETAWICAFAHCRRQPVLLEVKDVSFRAPVELGSLLFLSSQVTCSHGRRCVVRVHAEVLQPDSGLRTTTNDFYFVFAPEAAAQAGEDCVPDAPQVVPRSYSEAMLHIDGMRKLTEA
uniref:Acyl-coenzyme A thioesterase 9, mitochondrial n=2 Tax=Macrostomum lignano TaxID=282301 RepID=A0A1I8IY11_9PLAT